MLSRRLRRTVANKTATQRFASTTTEMPVQMRTVLAVETGDGTPGSAYATIDTEDGGTTTLAPVAGYLPAVGDQVPTVMNGDDPVSFAPRHMIDGDMQSRTWTGTDGPTGWLFTADGVLYAVNGIFRGDVTAQAFRTAEDPTIDGSVEVTSTFGVGRLIFRAPGPLQATPAMIRSEGDTLDLAAPGSTAQVLVGFEGGVYIGAGSGPIQLSAPGFDITANDISLVDPPMRELWRLGATQTIPHATATTVLLTASLDHAPLVGGGDAVTFDPATGQITPKAAGRWEIAPSVNLSTIPGEYGASLGYSFNGGATVWETIDTYNGLQHPAFPLQFTRELRFNGTTDQVRIRVHQTRGADTSLDVRSVLIRRASA